MQDFIFYISQKLYDCKMNLSFLININGLGNTLPPHWQRESRACRPSAAAGCPVESGNRLQISAGRGQTYASANSVQNTRLLCRRGGSTSSWGQGIKKWAGIHDAACIKPGGLRRRFSAQYKVGRCRVCAV